MKTVVYHRTTGRIRAIHEYNGTPRSFSHLPDGYVAWHVPSQIEELVLGCHEYVEFEDGKPVCTINIRHDTRMRADELVIPDLWGLPNAEPEDGQEKALVVRFRGLGDVGMSWFGIEEKKRQNPDMHITYFTSPQSAALFCGQTGLVDKVMEKMYDHTATPEPVNVPTDIMQYDYVYNMINKVDFGEIVFEQPRADNFADLLGVEIPDDAPIRPMVISDKEREWIGKRLKVKDGEILIACQLSSNGRPRVWRNWPKLAKLCRKAGLRMVYLSTDRRHMAEKKYSNVINLSCRTTVREYIASLYAANIIVCPDSSALHIGARIPHAQVIGLFGSTGAWAHTAYYKNVHCIPSLLEHDDDVRKTGCSPCWDWQKRCCDGLKHFPMCMWKITAEEIFAKVKEVLDGKNARD